MRVTKFLKQVKAAGFTLTELMAVVIILAILAAIAAGSYKKAMERGHFNEGLTAAHTVLSGVETYYAEEGQIPTIDQLPVALSNPKACATPSDKCVKTKYFEVTIEGANRADTSVIAKRTNGMYSIRVYPSSMGRDITDRCRGNEDFCKSVGYTVCSVSSGVSSCYKPN